MKHAYAKIFILSMLSLETIKCINYMLIDIKLNFTKLYWTSLIKGLKFIKNLRLLNLYNHL
jgi:hypothetical protein